MRHQCPSCRLRIKSPQPPLHCPRCVARGRGRFEMVAVHFAAHAQPTSEGARDRPRADGHVEVREYVSWAECREIAVRGEFDAAACPWVGEVLGATVGAGLPCVTLDLRECEFLDASALALIAAVGDRLERHGQEFIVSRPPSGQPARLMRVTAMPDPGPAKPEVNFMQRAAF
jgi:anti-anti-sigma regulatory factor